MKDRRRKHKALHQLAPTVHKNSNTSNAMIERRAQFFLLSNPIEAASANADNSSASNITILRIVNMNGDPGEYSGLASAIFCMTSGEKTTYAMMFCSAVKTVPMPASTINTHATTVTKRDCCF